MFSKCILEFRRLNKSVIKRFSEQKKQVEQAKEEEVQPKQVQKKEKYQHQKSSPYIYAKEKFDLINDKSFIKKIEKMELMNRPRPYQLRTILPIVMLGGSLFIYHLWQVMPYSLIFKHTTISEYIPRQHYLHAIFLSPLAFQTTGHLLIYFPLMVASFVLCGKYMNARQFAALYITNAVIGTGITFAYERYKNSQLNINMISPKCTGATTPLSFASAFLAIKPNHLFLNNRALPYFIVPVLYYMYELQEFQSGYVTEVSRPAHLGSIAWGLIFGALFKKIVLKGIV